MRSSIFTPLLALTASVSALTITFPSASDSSQSNSVDLSVSQDITWTTVSTDPASFKLTLVSVNSFPVTSIVIADSIKTSDLKYTMKPQSKVTIGGKYQIDFNNATTNGIIAQSAQFNVSNAAPNTTTSSTTSSPSSTPSKGAASTVRAYSGAGLAAIGFAAFLF